MKPLTRKELQQIARMRRSEVSALLKVKRYPGAYYLMGYPVECALKACIATQTRRHDFPNKDLANKAYTHNLETLLKLSGLGTDLNKAMAADKSLEVNWAVVKDWDETARYDAQISAQQARDLYSACTARTHGILTWIRKQW